MRGIKGLRNGAIISSLAAMGLLLIGGKEVKLSTGEFCITPRNVPHALQAKEKFKMLLVRIKG